MKNELIHSTRKSSFIISAIAGLGFCFIALWAYFTSHNPWTLLLLLPGIFIVVLFRVDSVPISVSPSSEGLTVEYARPARTRIFNWKDIQTILAVNRRGGLGGPRFHSLWLLDHKGKKITWQPLHMSVEILNEIRRFLESNQYPTRIETVDRDFLLGP